MHTDTSHIGVCVSVCVWGGLCGVVCVCVVVCVDLCEQCIYARLTELKAIMPTNNNSDAGR